MRETRDGTELYAHERAADAQLERESVYVREKGKLERAYGFTMAPAALETYGAR